MQSRACAQCKPFSAFGLAKIEHIRRLEHDIRVLGYIVNQGLTPTCQTGDNRNYEE